MQRCALQPNTQGHSHQQHRSNEYRNEHAHSLIPRSAQNFDHATGVPVQLVRRRPSFRLCFMGFMTRCSGFTWHPDVSLCHSGCHADAVTLFRLPSSRVRSDLCHDLLGIVISALSKLSRTAVRWFTSAPFVASLTAAEAQSNRRSFDWSLSKITC